MSDKVKTMGVVYTPEYVVDKMIEMSGIVITDKILEPSCGHGAFLFGLLRYAKQKFNIHGEDLFKWFNNNITAIEIIDETVNELKVLLIEFFTYEGVICSEKDLFGIINADTLFYEFDRNNTSFDVCIGNPPYIRNKNINKEYLLKLRDNFISCKKGNIDIYYAFIEKSNKLARKTVLITPNGFLSNVSAKNITKIIRPHFVKIIDFKENKVFKGVGTYTCILFLDKEKLIDEIEYSNSILEIPKKIPKDTLFGSERVLSSNNIVLSGIATLKDSAYIIDRVDTSGKLYKSVGNQVFEIEKEICVPFIKISKFRSLNDIKNKYIIYPYDSEGKIIKEEFLKIHYPKAYSYLIFIKDELRLRDKGKTDKYESWYAYGRKQGFHKVVEDRAIFIPKMMNDKNVPIEIALKDINAIDGKFLFVSGYVVPIRNDNIEFTKFLKSKRFLQYSKIYGKVWNGKDKFYSLTATQIKNIDINESF